LDERLPVLNRMATLDQEALDSARARRFDLMWHAEHFDDAQHLASYHLFVLGYQRRCALLWASMEPAHRGGRNNDGLRLGLQGYAGANRWPSFGGPPDEQPRVVDLEL
jgi:hypothetical protein